MLKIDMILLCTGNWQSKSNVCDPRTIKRASFQSERSATSVAFLNSTIYNECFLHAHGLSFYNLTIRRQFTANTFDGNGWCSFDLPLVQRSQLK